MPYHDRLNKGKRSTHIHHFSTQTVGTDIQGLNILRTAYKMFLKASTNK
jgi:hypothetical protein